MANIIHEFKVPRGSSSVMIDLSQLQLVRLQTPRIHRKDDSVAVRFHIMLTLRHQVAGEPIEWIESLAPEEHPEDAIARADAALANLRVAWEKARHPSIPRSDRYEPTRA